MDKSIKAKRDEMAEWYTEVEGYKDSHRQMFKNGFDAGLDQGYAMAMEEAKVLVDCLEQISNDSANEVAYLADAALKEFKAKVGE